MNRRKFLKSTCVSCLAIGTGFEMLSLQSCSTMQVLRAQADKGIIEVDVTAFAAANAVIVRAENMEYDILLVKQDTDVYKALLMQCTHRDYALNANTVGLYCTAHGSRFDLSGNVLEGPATAPLKRFKTSLQQNKIIVQL